MTELQQALIVLSLPALALSAGGCAESSSALPGPPSSQVASDMETPFIVAPLVVDEAIPLKSDVAAGRARFDPAPIVPLRSESSARLIVDSPLPEMLALGRVVLRYRTDNLRIMPVF